MFVIDRDTLLCVRFYISIEIQAMTNTPSCSTSGFPKITVTSVCAATTFPTTFGSGKAFSKQRRGMWCITATSKNTSRGMESGAESRRHGIHRCSLRSRFRQYESSHQGIDEAGLGAENRPRRASRFAVEHGQHLHPNRHCRKYQGRQSKKHGED